MVLFERHPDPRAGLTMLAEVVREAARRFGGSPAFVAEDGWTLSFADLDRRSDEVAGAFVDRGIGDGDVVALVLPSTLDYVVAYAALAKRGAITAGVNPRLTAPERAAAVATAAPDLVLATTALAEGLDEGPAIEVVECRATDADRLLDGLGAGRGTLAADRAPADADAPVAIVFTSGTTGNPKGAVFAGRQLRAIAEADWGVDRWGGGGAMLAATQFAHVGFMTKLPWYLISGGTTHLLTKWRAADALELIAEHHMAAVGGVAPQLALMLRVPDFDDHDLSAVQAIIMGGGPSPPALVDEARRRFDAAYSIRYSSTESGGIGLGTAFDADDEEALFTVGRPRPGVHVRVVDDDGRVAGDGEVGELCLRSPMMMSGYWNDPEATAAVLRDGWLHTGDLARIDDAGCVRLAGRKKEMYVRGGYNVYPMEVEAVLASHPDVVAVAVVPRPDDVMGEVGVAVVVPRDPAHPPTVDDLRRQGAESLASFKLPDDVALVDALPLTPMNKVDRPALADLVAVET
jgi:acyl-CoA synthetase (AMP-forming)/AMP-acid ligase II